MSSINYTTIFYFPKNFSCINHSFKIFQYLTRWLWPECRGDEFIWMKFHWLRIVFHGKIHLSYDSCQEKLRFLRLCLYLFVFETKNDIFRRTRNKRIINTHNRKFLRKVKRGKKLSMRGLCTYIKCLFYSCMIQL